MKIVLDAIKSVSENASYYYERSKKAKKKVEGAKKAYNETLKKIENLKIIEKEKPKLVKRKKEWYEKFRWFFTSENKLVIAGRDATTNDIIVKKHLEKKDLIFHTELPGSPFVIIKYNGEAITELEKEEAAVFCISNSKAWNSGESTGQVYYINPEQVSKTAPTGMYLPKGSFTIAGKRNYLKPKVELAVGLLPDNRVTCAPLTAVKKSCKKIFLINQGNTKKSDAAKKLKYEFEKFYNLKLDLDEIMQVLPPGECNLKEI